MGEKVQNDPTGKEKCTFKKRRIGGPPVTKDPHKDFKEKNEKKKFQEKYTCTGQRANERTWKRGNLPQKEDNGADGTYTPDLMDLGKLRGKTERRVWGIRGQKGAPRHRRKKEDKENEFWIGGGKGPNITPCCRGSEGVQIQKKLWKNLKRKTRKTSGTEKSFKSGVVGPCPWETISAGEGTSVHCSTIVTKGVQKL